MMVRAVRTGDLLEEGNAVPILVRKRDQPTLRLNLL